MAFGFPARARGCRQFAIPPDQLSRTTADALTALGWPFLAPSPTHYEVSISVSMCSWGERMKIDIALDGTVNVKSQCAFPLQWFDWGRNSRNVERFFDQLSGTVSQWTG